jgi:signal transduction histidine kinase
MHYALFISVILQIVAVIVVASLIKSTKYNSSWILLAIGLFIMALSRILELISSYFELSSAQYFQQVNSWMGVLISILMVTGVFFIKKVFRYLSSLQEIRAENEKRILNAIIHTEENERKRFAKDLHDGLGPLLSAVKMSLSALSKDKGISNRQELLEGSLQTVNEAIRSLKEISINLSPHILENFGLPNAIQSFCSKINQTEKISIHFRTNLGEQRFKGNIEVVIYRTACELINNTIQHGNAKTVLISLDREGDVLKFLYQEDGDGFDYQEVILNNKRGMGLNNLRTRIGSLNGSFKLESMCREGVIVSIEIPVII